ncbi:hypothetical protein A2U01_0084056 [Trifolium medium]|uniref:Uncharacterized protein n=1 Tax=Trifolium medium TaxID=97028 RepID=A0A392TNQ5_9FABA|nr:hypothetical protein [Trifolium medium]
MSNKRTTKPAGMLQLDKETAYQKARKGLLEAEVKKIQETCDFCQENHLNSYCIPGGVLEEEQAKFMGRPNPYSS